MRPTLVQHPVRALRELAPRFAPGSGRTGEMRFTDGRGRPTWPLLPAWVGMSHELSAGAKCGADSRLSPDRAARQRRLRRSLEVRGARRPLQGHQVRLRQPQFAGRGRRPRRAGTARPSTASRKSAIPSSCRWTASRSSGGELVIVMELADKSLHDAFEECLAAGLVGIPRDTLLRYIRDAAEGLDHMNEKHNLQHLDIKPRNLFLVSDRVKVGRFRPGQAPRALQRFRHARRRHAAVRRRRKPSPATSAAAATSTAWPSSTRSCSPASGPSTARTPASWPSSTSTRSRTCAPCPKRERPVVARALSKDPAKRFPNCLAFVRALYTRPVGVAGRSSAVDGNGGAARPKTMADTMEDILLEQMSAADAVRRRRARRRATSRARSRHRIAAGRGVAPGHDRGPAATGALRPTMVIGLGAFGRRALLELRCRFLDRFGDLDKTAAGALPLHRHATPTP